MNNVERILLDLETKYLIDRPQLAKKHGFTPQAIHNWVARNKISKKARMLLLNVYNIDFRDYKDGVFIKKDPGSIDLDAIEKDVDNLILLKIQEIERLLKVQTNTINTQAETINKLLEK